MTIYTNYKQHFNRNNTLTEVTYTPKYHTVSFRRTPVPMETG